MYWGLLSLYTFQFSVSVLLIQEACLNRIKEFTI